MSKPEGMDEYMEWATANLDSPFNDQKIDSLYDTNMNNIFNGVSQHPFFVGFSRKSKDWQKTYKDQTKTDLFIDSDEPKLVVKPFSSTVEKTYRQNVLWNRNFPQPPKGGWYTHQNVYSRLNDLVRGSLVCRFIDGPSFVAQAIEDYAGEHGLESRQYTHERDDGYYAFHVYIKFPVTLIDLEWNKTEATAEVEIQLTTQLQEVLRSLTHKFYESQRLAQNPDKGKWKWDFSSSRFKVGYLSHTLHLLESVILESRDSVMNQEGQD
jgi:ppGpp synthetase/RelA/SpoT-type nucleotidyltranferase